jgi:Ca2+/Na+ antiporter
MLAATAAMLPFLIFGLRLGRPAGVAFLVFYGAYIALLILGPADLPARIG